MAESIAREMIQHDASYAEGYFALGLVAEHAGRSAQAREQFAAAEKFWSKADEDLPELRHIHEGVSAGRWRAVLPALLAFLAAATTADEVTVR